MAKRHKLTTAERVAVFKDHGGKCHLCNLPIMAGSKWEVSHAKPLEMGGGGHLSWKDHNGNMADMVAHGRSQRGERQWKSKLSASDIEKIKILPGLQREIADQFGITQSNVSYIRSGKTWKHLEPPPPATLEDYR